MDLTSDGANIGVRDGWSGGGAVDPPPIRADMTFIRAKDKTFVRDHSGKTGFDPQMDVGPYADGCECVGSYRFVESCAVWFCAPAKVI